MARRPERILSEPEETTSPEFVGHNLPSPSLGLTAEGWKEWLEIQYAELSERKRELVEEFLRFNTRHERILDENVQGRAGDMKDKFTALAKEAEAMHALEKAPILVAQRAVDGFLRNFRAPLDYAIATINDRRTAFALQKEAEQRKRAQDEAKRREAEAQRLAAEAAATLDTGHLQAASDAAAIAEAAANLATASAAELSRVQGPLGSTSSLRTAWQFKPEESSLPQLISAVASGKAPVDYLTFNNIRISYAVRHEKVRDVPGLTIVEVKNVR